MADTVSPATRSRIMSKIRSKDTKPEIVVRRRLHGLGYRYRLHRRDLPGRPDLVFASRRKIVFVNGCFWHNHLGCVNSHIPADNQEYWVPKLARNRERDERSISLLNQGGWEVTVVWECQMKDMEMATERLIDFLERDTSINS